MSIELIQAAQQALSALEKSQPHPSNPVIGLTNQDFIDHEETIRQLRTAIQQPATSERVPMTDDGVDAKCLTIIGHLLSRRERDRIVWRMAEANHGITAQPKGVE